MLTWIRLPLVLLVAGCAASVPPAVSAFEQRAAPWPLSLHGAVRGVPAPEGARVVILWQIAAGEEEAICAYGEGAAQGAHFAAGLPDTEPPPEAMNDLSSRGIQTRLAIGLLVMLRADAPALHGRIEDFDAVAPYVAGASARHAVIWRDGEPPGRATPRAEWLDVFPTGRYACGACEARPPGQLESFVPVDCGAVELVSGSLDALDMCEWN